MSALKKTLPQIRNRCFISINHKTKGDRAQQQLQQTQKTLYQLSAMMMKSTISAFLGMLCLCSAPAMARLLTDVEINNVTDVQVPVPNDVFDMDATSKSVDYVYDGSSGERGFGYLMAHGLWKNGNGKYKCENVRTYYWKDVKKVSSDEGLVLAGKWTLSQLLGTTSHQSRPPQLRPPTADCLSRV